MYRLLRWVEGGDGLPRTYVGPGTEVVFFVINSIIGVPSSPCPDSSCCGLSVSFVFGNCHAESVCS